MSNIPDTYKDVIATFISDLTTTFPEYSILWNKWKNVEKVEAVEGAELGKLFDYMITVFPERMFDILTQNEAIFDPNSPINTAFLPNVEFKLLYNTPGITANTKQAIWKYLQLIMMTIMGSIKNKSQFGETAGLFEGIDQEFLQEKLNESILKMGEFFENMKSDKTDGTPDGATPPTDGATGSGDLPDPAKMFEHLQSLFNGKIGSLAKEFAEEFSNDMKDILNEDDLKNATSIKDILPKLLKDPAKLMTLVKSIHTKVNTKMESGEISRDDLMRETQEMMSKMQEMGGVDNFADMLKEMADKMGMGGKNVRVDKSALKRMETNMKLREQMRKKLDLKRANNIVKNQTTGELNFVCGEEKQEKSYLEQNAEIDRLMTDLNLDTTPVPKPSNKKPTKKSKKSGKK
jgi:hypothetical protein